MILILNLGSTPLRNKRQREGVSVFNYFFSTVRMAKAQISIEISNFVFRRLFVVILSLGTVLGVGARGSEPTLIEFLSTPTGHLIEHHLLQNGLRLVLVKEPGPVASNLISINTFVLSGSTTEKRDPRLKRTGFAHLYEHMIFKGSKNFPLGYDAYVAAMGAQAVNATTNYDYTNYFATFPRMLRGSNQVDRIFAIEADRFFQPTTDDPSIRMELGAVEGELKKRADVAALVQWEAMTSFLGKNSPYSASIAGTLEELRASSFADFEYFRKTYYVPNNMVVFVSGTVETAEILAAAQKHMGTWPAQPLPELSSDLAPINEIAHTLEGFHPGAKMPLIRVAYQVPAGPRTQHHPGLYLLGELLSSAPESPLYEAFVETKWASSAQADLVLSRGLASFQISMTLRSGIDPAQAVAKLDLLTTDLAKANWDEEFVRSVKNKLALRDSLAFTRVEAWPRLLGLGFVQLGRFDKVLNFINEYKAVKVEDLRTIVSRWVQPSRRVASIFKSPSAPVAPAPTPNPTPMPQAPEPPPPQAPAPDPKSQDSTGNQPKQSEPTDEKSEGTKVGLKGSELRWSWRELGTLKSVHVQNWVGDRP